MKPQDILFLLILLTILWKRNPIYAVIVALLCLIISMPLFQLWVFYTAERLVMYGAGFLLLAMVLFYFEKKDK